MVSDTENLFRQVSSWHAAGRRVALATVVQTWGSAPRPEGSHLAVEQSGAFIGSVSGGCIEGAVVSEAMAVIADGHPRLLEFGVTDEQAWQVGLACGGRIQVFVESLDGVRRALFERLMTLHAVRQPVASVTRLADGAHVLLSEHGYEGIDELLLDSPTVSAELERMKRSGRSGLLPNTDGLFFCAYPCAPRMFVVGAVHIAQFLVPMAIQASFQVTVIDPRRAFGSNERFPNVTLVDDWPDEFLARTGIDASTAVVTLTHDPKLDDPALAAALASPAFYIGALGSARTHASRMARLNELGFGEQTHRIRAPIGLPLGGRAPVEIAVAILAQIIKERYSS